MTDKEHLAYCRERVKMFVEMMRRNYPETKKNNTKKEN
jgi:hypothetical protein